MRLATALITAAALLLAPAAASAKEITKVRVCGTDGCVTTRDPAILAGLMDGGPPTVPPGMRGGVVSLRSSISEGDKTVAHFTSWWAPEVRELVAEDGTWMRLPAGAEAAITRLASGLEPLPASTIGLATPTPARSAAAGDGGGGVPGWLLIALGAAALGLAAVLFVRRRPRGDFPVPAP